MLLGGPEEASNARMVRRHRDFLTPKIIFDKDLGVHGFELPSEFLHNLSKENWIIGDTGKDNTQRVVAFSSPETLNILATSKHLFVDGTFEVCPKSFYQLL